MLYLFHCIPRRVGIRSVQPGLICQFQNMDKISTVVWAFFSFFFFFTRKASDSKYCLLSYCTSVDTSVHLAAFTGLGKWPGLDIMTW